MSAAKKRVLGKITGIVICCYLAACAPNVPEIEGAEPNQSLIQSYANAYNSHDLDAMSALMHDDIEWINIENSTQSIITSDKNALIAELKSYFDGNPQSVSALSDWSVNGNYVSAKETVTFAKKDGSKGRQASLSVYELENGLIRRVWYFPAQK